MKPTLLLLGCALLSTSALAQSRHTLRIVDFRPSQPDVRTPVGVRVELDVGVPYGQSPGGVITVGDGLTSCKIAVDGLGPYVCNWQPSVAGVRSLAVEYERGPGQHFVGVGQKIHVAPASSGLERASVPFDRTLPMQFHSRGVSTSRGRALSADGRWAVFLSDSPRLLESPRAGALTNQVFLADLQTGRVVLVSNAAGAVPNGPSFGPAISGDGRQVAFASTASNLVAGDTNGVADVFVYDRVTGALRCVTPGWNGASFGASLSADGSRVAFVSNATNPPLGAGAAAGPQVYVLDLVSGALTLVSRGLAGAPAIGLEPQLAAGGRHVVFSSPSSTLVVGDTNNVTDIFVFDLKLATLERVSRRADGSQTQDESFEPSISAEGKSVAFLSLDALDPQDTNGRTDAYVVHAEQRRLRRVSVTPAGAQTWGDTTSPQLSGDGKRIGFGHTADLSGTGADTLVWAAYVRGVDDAASLVEVSRRPSGARAFSTPAVSLSGDGRFALFSNDDPFMVWGSGPQSFEVWVRDLARGVVRKVSAQHGGSEGADDSFGPAVSADGRYVAFRSYADNLGKNDLNGLRDIHNDVLVRDRQGPGTELVTRVVGVSYGATELSRDGRFVLYSSSGLTSPPGNNLFRYDRSTQQTVRLTRTSSGGAIATELFGFSTADDGARAVFGSDAPDLVAGDGNGVSDVFEVNAATGATRRVSVGVGGVQANGASHSPTVSGDGLWVVYSSEASNLVSGDTNGLTDVFATGPSGATVRLGQPAGGEANGGAGRAQVSGNGRWVVFESSATNLGFTDTNGGADIFLQDLTTGALTLVSRTPAGSAAGGASRSPTVSDDGGRVAFISDAADLTGGSGLPIFVFERATGQVRRVSTAVGTSPALIDRVRLSGDGTTVVFAGAEALQAGDVNQSWDVFVAPVP
ncbi:MAG: PD40 domain-containing protein [Myxococcaceae bacterium]|nr:PD40 domain-containing protein [Myxococcaceae bacterium]